MKDYFLILVVVLALVIFGVGQMCLTFQLSQPVTRQKYSDQTWTQWTVPHLEHPNSPFGWQYIQERTNQLGLCEMRIVLAGM